MLGRFNFAGYRGFFFLGMALLYGKRASHVKGNNMELTQEYSREAIEAMACRSPIIKAAIITGRMENLSWQEVLQVMVVSLHAHSEALLKNYIESIERRPSPIYVER